MSAASSAIDDYLQSDAASRRPHFSAFLEALAVVARTDGAGAARDLARRAVSPALEYSALRRLRKWLPPLPASPQQLRCAVLGGPTTAQLVELLSLFLAGLGIDAQIYEGPYGLFRQQLLASDSDLDRFKPQIVFLATSARDVGAEPDPGADRDAVAASLEAEVAGWERLWNIAHERWHATVIQNTFEPEEWPAFGHFGGRQPASRDRYLRALNDAFVSRAPPTVLLHDLSQLVAQVGHEAWFDSRWSLEAKMPCGPEALVVYAHSVAAVAAAAVGKARKVLALDLDNTLWGGVIGDVGIGGIRLGQGSSEGEAYIAFQRYAKALRARGIVMAVCSKNDEHQAREPFESHPDMVLRLDDVACFVACWRDKAEMLREVATRLQIGLQSIVFVDDNPAERAWVRHALPDVAVPDLPADPAGYVGAVARHRYFEMSSFTPEDAARSSYYRADAERQALASSSADLDQFLASLDMTARVEAVGPLNVERATQLINKTNQFNLTTRRRSLSEVQRLASDPSWVTAVIRLRDRFGDNGLIAVVLGHAHERSLCVDTWLMSCRVLQRGVEQLTLETLVHRARALGCDTLVGVYVPSGKNHMVRDLYPRLGFQPAGDREGEMRWVLSVAAYEGARHHIRTES